MKHNIREDEALEVTIDRTRAARKVYRDLLKITGIRDLPQIFVNETFIGGWQDLKTLHKTGAVGLQSSIYLHSFIL
jgi:glutaredoxin